MRTQHRAARRGQAAVELAVMMVVIVPLVFYTLFLQDLLSYRLDQQETIVAPPWDFSIVNYQKDRGKERAHEIGSNNRKTFCDHTSAYNTYSNYNNDCNGQEALEHHKSLAAHACWVAFGNNGQVQCAIDDGVGRPTGPQFDGFTAFYDNWNRGGLAHCTARLGVFNKFITQTFLQAGGGGASQVKVTRLKAHKDEGGPSGKGPSAALAQSHKVSIEDDPLLPKEQPQEVCTGDDQLCLQREFFAVLQDSWAVSTGLETRNREIENMDPNVWRDRLTDECTTRDCRLFTRKEDTIHPLFDRAATFYATHRDQAAVAQDYIERLKDSRVLADEIGQDSVGDNLMTPTMNWNDSPLRPTRRGCGNCGWNSGGIDQRQQDFRNDEPISATGIW